MIGQRVLHLRVLHVPTVSTRRSRPIAFRKEHSDGGEDTKGAPATVYTSVDPVHGGLSPYSQSVLMALIEKRRTFRELKVDLSTKPTDFVELYHSIVTDKAAREAVPLLVDGKTRLVESRIIAEYLARQYVSQGAPLLPPDPTSQALVSLFIQQFHDRVVPPYLRLIHVEDKKAVAEATADLMDALTGLDDFLSLHGGYQGEHAVGPHYSWSMHSEDSASDGSQQHPGYFMGPYYSLAEVLCTPFVARMVHVLPEWREVDVLAAAKEKGLQRLVEWMEACLERPSARMTGPRKDELVEGLAEWEWSHAM